MKNILLLTNIYPNNDPGYAGTAVCHSFTKEWAKSGYGVKVVHFDSLFPRPYYWVGRLFNQWIQAKTGTVAYTNTPHKPVRYTVEGIPVLFVPLRKLIPHKAPGKRCIEKAFRVVIDELDKEGFVPDVVTAHFVLPQLQFLPLFKEHYPRTRTCLVLHGTSGTLFSCYPKTYKEMMPYVDTWGFRSLAFLQDFQSRFSVEKPLFLCPSGIPEKYLVKKERNYSHGISRFVFVGSLYELKNVDVTIRALHKAMAGKEYTFDIVGSGSESDNLHRLVRELGMSNHVKFHGQMKRDDAQEILKNAECFVMVSSREAFGLVYIEAMAKGCVVIGTKGQGIDGIVRHGENGFLCQARDVDGLAQVLTNITTLSPLKLNEISEKAMATAAELTDAKVAEHYINAIIK